MSDHVIIKQPIKLVVSQKQPVNLKISRGGGGGGGGAVSSVNGKTGAVVINKTDVGLGNVDNTSDANKPISAAVAAALALKGNITQKPLPLGSRVIGLGDSIMAGVSPTGQLGSGGPYTDSRPNFNAWFNRMCYGNPHRYFRIRNAGIGGDVTGGYGKTTSVVTSGLTLSVTYTVTKGNPMFGANTFYLGALNGTNDAKIPNGHVDNGGGSYTVTFATTTLNSWPANSDIRWGMLGRLQTDVINWNPEVCYIHAGTNDLNNVTPTRIVAALMDMVTDLRAANIEPILMEILPRSTYQTLVVQTNDILRHACRIYSAGSVHLIPMYDVFAGSTGSFASGTYTADGLHPSPVGNVMMANLVDSYMEKLPMRISKVPVSAIDTDPTNLLQGSHFLTSFAAGGGQVPTGWTYNPFFTTNTIPSIVAPGVLDGIKGNWFRWVCTAAAGTTSIRKSLSTQPAVGDLILFTCRLKTVGLTGGMSVTVNLLDGGYNDNLIYNLAEDQDGMFITASARMSAASSAVVEFLVTPVGGSGEMWVAEPLVQNLTALGRT